MLRPGVPRSPRPRRGREPVPGPVGVQLAVKGFGHPATLPAAAGHDGAVLVPARMGAQIADGSVTVLFRRWRRCQAVPGHVYRTAAGRLQVDAVDVVDPTRIRAADAHRAGYRTTAELVADLRGDRVLPVYRVRVHLAAGPDPRSELAATAAMSPDEAAAITARLDRLDRVSSHGTWTAATLLLIASRPAVRAGDLAATLGRQRLPFKVDVRKLKNLGLTISLDVGYRLSPRGAAYLALSHRSGPR